MALMQCPECSGKVSSFAITCPHCGYPVGIKNVVAAASVATPTKQTKSNGNLCRIDGRAYDLTPVLNLVKQGPNYKIAAVGKMREITHCKLNSAKDFVETMYRTHTIPESVFF